MAKLNYMGALQNWRESDMLSSRKGGIIRYIRHLIFSVFVLTLLTLIIFSKIYKMKKNYTELHGRVTELERICH